MNNERDMRSLLDLRAWDDNPREITQADLERLKKKLTARGQLEPLIITADGTVIGGNARLRAMMELGWTEAWVSVVEAKTDAEKLRYALSDNDHAGHYVEDDLRGLIAATPGITSGLFRFPAGSGQSLAAFMERQAAKPAPGTGEPAELGGDGAEDAEPYISRIILNYPDERFRSVLGRLGAVIEKEGLNNHTEALLTLLEKAGV